MMSRIVKHSLHNHKNNITSLKIQLAATPAQSPPIVWLKIAFPVSLFTLSEDIIATCVLRYPLQHMHIAVNTATSLARTVPASAMCGTSPIAAPAALSAVIGTEIPDASVNPKAVIR